MSKTHQLSGHRLYHVWQGAKNRCYNPNEPRFADYGGRGIVVCASWRDDFPKFLRWALRHGWEPELQMDRRNNDGNYSPRNCRFVTVRVNSQNKRTTRLTPELVAKVKSLLRANTPGKNISVECGISAVALYQIKIGRTWSNIP